MAGKRKVGMSWGEVSRYENCVDAIRLASLRIAKETRRYESEGMTVSDGDIYLANIMSDYKQIQSCMKQISADSKKYGRL